MVGGWKKLYNLKLYAMHCSPNIIRMIKSRQVAEKHVGVRRSRVMLWCGNLRERGPFEELDLEGMIISRSRMR
jgi:hypothetical protein